MPDEETILETSWKRKVSMPKGSQFEAILHREGLLFLVAGPGLDKNQGIALSYTESMRSRKNSSMPYQPREDQHRNGNSTINFNQP